MPVTPEILVAQRKSIPIFFLYGEARREVGPRFLHLEPLEDRSRPSQWNIRAHAHANLNHIFFMTSGIGVTAIDGAKIPFAAPCLLLIPAGVVHGFSYTPNAAGWVLTIASAYLNELIGREPDFAAIFQAPHCLPAGSNVAIEDRLGQLAQELVWNAPGYAAAIEGHLLGILVEVLRLSRHCMPDMRRMAGRAAEIVAQFKAQIEKNYRSAAPLRNYASSLRISQGQLRRACLQIARQTPISLLQERTFIEAQRVLLYTNMTIIETADHLGFTDGAYFTRFFKKHAGRSPRAFRRQSSEVNR